MGALRPLDARVCVALGFADLSVMGSDDDENECGTAKSQALSQLRTVTKVGGPVTTLLLKLLQRSLSDALSEKKGASFKARMEGGGNSSSNLEEDVDDNDNPYLLTTKEAGQEKMTTAFADIALASCEESSKRSFALLDCLLRGGVFASVYEHLAAVAELRCNSNSNNDDEDSEEETERRLVETAQCLFSCITSLTESKLLTRSPTGRMCLSEILKQIADGDRNDYASSEKNGKRRLRRPTAASMNKLMGNVMDNVNEIVTGAYTGDLDFAMDGVSCMQSIFECSKRISDTAGADVGVKKRKEIGGEEGEDASSFATKLSNVANKMLSQNWPDDTKMNKGNIGKLLTLFIEHSSNRMEALSNLVRDVLSEVPHLDKKEKCGVAAFPTCSHQTFGCYYSTCLEYIHKELVRLFDSPLGKTKDPASALRAMDQMKEMITLLQSLFDLTKESESLAKKAILLQQLKFGSRFIETFVSKAIPFFQVHFANHQDTILAVIKLIQKWSRQLYHIIAHGKKEKDANLAKEAPRAKKALELFIHKVKAMLKKNRCMTAMCKCLATSMVMVFYSHIMMQ